MRTLIFLSVAGLVACTGGGGTPDAGVDAGPRDSGTGDAGNPKVSGASHGLVAQGDKVVVVGTSFTTSTDNDALLVRYNADGTLDTSFGTGGKVVTSFASYVDPLLADAGLPSEQKDDDAYAVMLQGDKLLVAGTSQSLSDVYGAFALARYSADGVLDTTFGTAGKVAVRVNTAGGPAHAVGLRSDGKIYAAGYVFTGTAGANGQNFGIVRFTADGAVDPAFGGATGVIGDFGKNEDARGIGFQTLKVLVGGGDDFAVARYNDDGSLDTTFGTAGLASSAGGYANNFRVLTSGALLLSGSRRTTGVADPPWVIKLVRYTADGQLDTGFGTGGVLEVSLDGHQYSTNGLDVMADGRVVTFMVGGYGTLDGVYATVARFSAAGVVDTTFGTSGVLNLHNVSLPLTSGATPPSPNQARIINGRLVYTETNPYGGQPTLYFGSIALP